MNIRRIMAASAALATVGLMVVACSTTRAPVAVADGAHVYRQKCADCHGLKGQGVEGKYAEALYGDWQLPKLTRYIAHNMPEDAPETLSPADAAAVSRYVYDEFYSRTAQARNHPARVELAHLTNRQYAISVADLVRRFAPADEPIGEGRGLSAVYYNSARRSEFDRTRAVQRRVDSEIEFDFTQGSGDRGHLDEPEFAVTWQGSLLVDETGDYELVVRTPNSVRLWLNTALDAATAAEARVEAFVASPLVTEHRVTARLLAGRAYPIRLDCWVPAPKLNDKPAGIALWWKPPHGTEQVVPARNLSPARAQPTLVVATAFPPDDSSLGYARGVAVSKAWDDATTRAAFEVANHVLKHLDRFARTTPGDAGRAEKVQRFCAAWVEAAFRRPLTAEERQTYVDEQFTAAAGPDQAVKRVVLLALKSPQFLYPNLDLASANDFTIASRLSYALWDSLPDPELLAAAARGELRTREHVVAHAERMLGDARARAKVRHFLHQWLQIAFVEDLQKDAALFPEFTPELVADLRTSLNLFLDDVVWQQPSGYRDLLLADYLYVNDRLARFYGLPPPAGGEFARVPVEAAQRAGVVTHPYLLAAFSYKSTTSPIHRGVFLTRNIVGRALKSPVMAVSFDDAGFAPGLSMREKVATLTKSETCQACHAVINPLGFSLEWYDPVGRFRQHENGRPIDAVSDYITDDGAVVRLNGARDVATFAANNEQAHHAFIEQLFHQMVQQPLRAYGPDALVELRRAFVAGEYSVPKLLTEMVALSALHGVKAEPSLVAAQPHPARSSRPSP